MGDAEKACRALLAKEAEPYLDAALAEARADGAKEGRAFTSLTTDHWRVRRAALEEAASHPDVATCGLECAAKIRALADKPPPDCGWRDRIVALCQTLVMHHDCLYRHAWAHEAEGILRALGEEIPTCPGGYCGCFDEEEAKDPDPPAPESADP